MQLPGNEISSGASTSLPFLTVIVPTLNEEAYIDRLLDSLARQTYRGPFEVLIADGGSRDKTRDIVTARIDRNPWLRLVDNPGRTQGRAFNRGLREGRGEIIAYVGAHSELADDYLEQVVQAFEESGADGVGGSWVEVKSSGRQAWIAGALDSPFGPGPSRFRHHGKANYTFSLLFGSYRREAVENVGGMDEDQSVNEDYELNHRLHRAGYRLYYSPRIRITYYSRPALGRLWRQYTRYGFWKARVVRKHPEGTRWWHLVAPTFVAGLVLGLPLALFSTAGRAAYFTGIAAYAVANVAAAVGVGSKHGWKSGVLAPVAFVVMHVAWGLGFFAGVWRWWIRNGAESGQPTPGIAGGRERDVS